MKVRVLAAFAVLSLSALAVEPVEVRVRQTAGGPQLFVDGVAVRPRWVYPAHGAKLVMAEKEPRRFSFDFDVASAEAYLRVQLSFNKILRGRERASVTVRDVAITAADGAKVDFTGKWEIVDNGSTGEGTVGADGTLSAAIHPAKETHVYGNFCFDAKVRAPAKGRCTLSFEALSSGGQPVYPRVYEYTKTYYQRRPLGEDDYDATIRLAAAAGVDIVTPPLPSCWRPPEMPQDWSQLDAQMRHLVALNPRALVVPRIGADMPEWMLKDHPEYYMLDDKGVRQSKGSVSCRPYRRAAVAHVEKLTRHLQETFPRHFAGLHVCGQNTGEWFYYHSNSDHYLGYDVSTRDAFRDWLRQEGDPDAATAEVPTARERRAGLADGFHDPARARRVTSFNAFQQHEIVSLLNDFGAAIRRGSNGKCLAVFFYGYHWELAGTGAESGHLGVNWLIENARENIDMLGAPISYAGRRTWPGTADVMSPAETLARAGIMWIHEDDTRTYREPVWDFITCCGGPKIDKAQTIRTLRRNLAQDAIRGFGCWWMDLFGRGWFADPDLWQVLDDLKPLDEAMLRRSRPFSPDIAFLTDETSMALTAGPLRPGMAASLSRGAFSACGAPYGQYLVEDVAKRPLDAKLRYYAVACGLPESARAALASDRLSHPERTRVWCWASGLVTPTGADVAAMQRLTGFETVRLPAFARDVYPTPLGIRRGLRKDAWPTKHDVQLPLFTVRTNATDEVWATYAGGEPAIVVRRHAAGGADVFAGNVRAQGPEEIAAYARLAGVHLYSAPGKAAVWAAEGFTMVQALEAGELALDFGNGQTKTDAFGLGDVKIYRDAVETCLPRVR